jgi:hypothetical protein
MTLKQILAYVTTGGRLDFNENVEEFVKIPIQVKELCEKCWATNPSERPTIEIVLEQLNKLEQQYFPAQVLHRKMMP